MTWSTRVVEMLCECKREGLSFAEAWEEVLEAHPPGSRDLGPRVQQLIPDGEEASSLVEFTREACSDSWHGRRPVLAHLGHLMELLEEVEEAAVGRTFGPRSASRGSDRLVA